MPQKSAMVRSGGGPWSCHRAAESLTGRTPSRGDHPACKNMMLPEIDRGRLGEITGVRVDGDIDREHVDNEACRWRKGF